MTAMRTRTDELERIRECSSDLPKMGICATVGHAVTIQVGIRDALALIEQARKRTDDAQRSIEKLMTLKKAAEVHLEELGLSDAAIGREIADRMEGL